MAHKGNSEEHYLIYMNKEEFRTDEDYFIKAMHMRRLYDSISRFVLAVGSFFDLAFPLSYRCS